MQKSECIHMYQYIKVMYKPANSFQQMQGCAVVNEAIYMLQINVNKSNLDFHSLLYTIYETCHLQIMYEDFCNKISYL